MTLPELGRMFRLTEAFYVERAVSDGVTALGLRGRVKTRNQIAQLVARCFDPLVIGEAAYEGDPGFVGEPVINPPNKSALVRMLHRRAASVEMRRREKLHRSSPRSACSFGCVCLPFCGRIAPKAGRLHDGSRPFRNHFVGRVTSSWRAPS